MNRRNRTLLVLLLAVALAAAATYGVFRMIQSIPVREVEIATKQVAIAVEDLPMGTRLTKDLVKLTPWPEGSPLEGSFESLDAVLGRGLIQPVAANEPLTERKLAPIEAGAGLPPSIPPGMRALSVRVNDVIGVAGFTVPGTRVDLVVTLRQSQNQDTMSRTVVSNVQVLTAGTLYDQEAAKDGKPVPSTVVTLMVTPEDAERIVLAQSAGSIMLVLRNPLDVVPTETSGARLASLTGAPPPSPVITRTVQGQRRVVAPPPPPAPPKPYMVETIRAAQRKAEVIR